MLGLLRYLYRLVALPNRVVQIVLELQRQRDEMTRISTAIGTARPERAAEPALAAFVPAGRDVSRAGHAGFGAAAGTGVRDGRAPSVEPAGRLSAGELFDPRDIPALARHVGEQMVRSRCHAVYLGDHTVLARCLGRYKMLVDSRDLGLAPHIMLEGFWEWWLTQFMIGKVGEGMAVLDIGANFGYYTLLLSDLVGATGRCLAFEPNPAVAERLERSVDMNGFSGRTRVLRCALGREPEGSLPFFVPAGQPKNATVVDSSFVAPDGSGTLLQVPVTTVDRVVEGRTDFVKIDAEGAEYDIIMGMRDTIARDLPRMVVEFNAARNYDGRALLDYLCEVYGGLSYVDVDAHAKPATIDRVMREDFGNDWLLYFERAGRRRR
ncbi:FkbM family methyltransferase [Arenibaculum pallidiluteum]|uniref:FkbM family methyltransferase n=1 Tax=Arenibaculum pallidiluteum TaxID=2812559 RepID=UPI001A9665E2|nr:FkbM family methyltransferase [Arenibaculum pallidiluteum]